MYSLNGFGEMMRDRIRMDAYKEVLRRVIKPNSVVLEIGTGTGVFAILAHRFGARRVIAVEPGDGIQVAREIAVANDCTDDIEFHQIMSTELQLDEPADVIFSDLRGVLPLFQQHIPSIIDARTRLLARDGILVPQSDRIFLSVIEDVATYQDISTPWAENDLDIDMRPGLCLAVNQWRRIAATDAQLLTPPAACGDIDYRIVEKAGFTFETTMTAHRTGVAHGLCAWFDATLHEDIHFSNAPRPVDQARPIYRNAFFPFPRPVELDECDTIHAVLKADLIGEDYVWRWDTRVFAANDAARTKAAYRQSSLAGEALSLQQLRRRASDHVPSLNASGEMDLATLQWMRDGLPLGEVATRLLALHGKRFASWQQALAYVGELSLRYSR